MRWCSSDLHSHRTSRPSAYTSIRWWHTHECWIGLMIGLMIGLDWIGLDWIGLDWIGLD